MENYLKLTLELFCTKDLYILNYLQNWESSNWNSFFLIFINQANICNEVDNWDSKCGLKGSFWENV